MSAVMKPRSRIIDHGEVFTPPQLVNDMLDLPGVADECLRIDARFLEPACGDGNFLAEVLRRRLIRVSQSHPKTQQHPWERDALVGLSNLYGIELLHDNVQACRDRLYDLFESTYTQRFGNKHQPAILGAARHLVTANIFHGDALAMTTVGDAVYPAKPLVFTEWSMLPRGRFKRKRFEYRELIGDPPGAKPALFSADVEPLLSDLGKPVFLARPVDDLPLVHYSKLAEEPNPLKRPITEGDA